MSETYPPQVRQFVEQELASGSYQSEDELVIEALQVFRELKSRHQRLRTDVQESIAQAERGAVKPLDTEATKAEARRQFTENS